MLQLKKTEIIPLIYFHTIHLEHQINPQHLLLTPSKSLRIHIKNPTLKCHLKLIIPLINSFSRQNLTQITPLRSIPAFITA